MIKNYKYKLLLISSLVLLYSCEITRECEQKEPFQVEVTGADYEWHIRYPGKDGVLYTQDDFFGKKDLHLPKGISSKITIRSKDFLYFLDLPAVNQIGLAVPDQEHVIEFTPTKRGSTPLRGNQMCAFTHENLLGKLKVHSSWEFELWLRRHQS